MIIRIADHHGKGSSLVIIRTNPDTEGMTIQLTHRDLDRIALVIDADGLDAVPSQFLHDVARHAARLGVGAVAAEVLVDTEAPVVVRERAFGRLAAHVANAERRADTRFPTLTPHAA
jgi:hypothetical protein